MPRPKQFASQPAWGPDDDHALLGLYVNGKALTEYADELGWCETSVRHAMVRLDLARAPQGRPPGRRNSDHSDRSNGSKPRRTAGVV